MKKILLYVAVVFLAIHGLIELLFLLFIGAQASSMPHFFFRQLEENIGVTCVLGGLVGLVRIIAAIGILKNLKWGLVLGILISVVTYTIMTFYLPMGIADGIFSGIVLVSSLMLLYGNEPIIKR